MIKLKKIVKPIEITGYYYREHDNQSFITYLENGRRVLSNGICRWIPTESSLKL